ncbi:putative alpha-1,2-mannosidase [Herbihabitans rhizosphaerae]|uniref:Putative alpha-1,2-mannosidase n=1 Tax=Herbihabitans rhizosphaerae TaxID=1872711 RepID=A0A4Q7L5R7_9PSEU|nr:GH92 family glycosyl hydrolase [Herbihabitans rhizosphaerae]RZS43612.1 putative alpha-1,2-mannosidase [Herbihabitans rhizosphaerae]
MTAASFTTSFETGDPTPISEPLDSEGVELALRVGGGPAHAPAAKTGVGFTGLRALNYTGTHRADGRGFVRHKLFAVDIPVTADTELSYVIFPELGGDLGYPATFVALDLALDDGTLLSDLGALDHLGFELSPAGQGAAKSLYPDQWNRRACRLGEIAAGRTVTAVLLGYDNPDGPAGFSGWIDDIAIRSVPARAATRPSEHVITTRGTHSSGGFSRGNTFPATAVPHGFNFWTPLTAAGELNWLYSWHQRNSERNLPALQAFSVSHQPSPWMGDRQTFHVMPSAAPGRPPAGLEERALEFSHDDEIARPHYYGVTFTGGVRAEIAPTDHAAMFRFTFPGPDASLVFDNRDCRGRLFLDTSRGVVTGYSDVRSGLSNGATRMFTHAEFDRPVIGGGRLWRWFGPRTTGHLRFAPAEHGETVVTMRIATSLISAEQARRNLELELPADTAFDDVVERAAGVWDDVLGTIEVDGATDDQLATLYGNLYRLFLYPNSIFENTGTAEAPVHRYASPVLRRRKPNTRARTGASIVDGRAYVNNGFWDTYRTVWPAYALLAPARCGELVNGFLRLAADGGWVPRWSSPGYANLMTGTSSDVAFADAYLKGVPGIDPHEAYRAALRNATVTPPHDAVGRKGIDRSIFIGYTPTSVHEGLSWALEGCVNDFGIANLAREIGAHEEAEYFLERARHYVHMFDERIGFFQGRNDDGTWRWSPDRYDPTMWGFDYTETNGWNTAFSVPHDGAGLATLHGGREALAAKLDEFFGTPETGTNPGSYNGIIHEMTEARDVRMGQYGHSNQPSHHIIHTYLHAGRPAAAQCKIREIMARGYSGSEIGQGYCGDEDNGEMSAWWLFNALGLYPLTVGSPYYVIGSPLFTKATVRLENGRTIVVEAPNNSAENVYVQALTVNSRPYTKTYLPHAMIAEGATLTFDMGPEPSDWGTDPAAAPPSVSPPGVRPSPLADVTLGATATGPDDVEIDFLFDDTTRSEVRFADGRVTIDIALTEPAAARFYTLTSGIAPNEDPRSWVLSGSTNGTQWTTVDRRNDENFLWRRQVRPFKVDSPVPCTHYRLELTGGQPPVTLAQIELLA